MPKLIKKDIFEILDFFGQLESDRLSNQISLIKNHQPANYNQAVSFQYLLKKYYILLDNQANDQKDYIMKQIRQVADNTNYRLLVNPKEQRLTTYAMPFKGKDCYLVQQVEAIKTRLDSYLATTFACKSRSLWQKHIKMGHTLVNNQVCQSVKYTLKADDKVDLNIPAEDDYSHLQLPIIYMDDDIIVINKPTGILSHSKGQLNQEFTVADFFKRYTTYQLDSNRPGIIHRLDRDTSGIMIGARHPEIASWLQKQFAERLTSKNYLAITSKIPKKLKARIDLPISRDNSRPKSFKINSNGKQAITDYEVLDTKDNKALVKLSPQTGRTHQIRVHLNYLGCPVLGDRVYSQAKDRLYLHAYSLTINLPKVGLKTFKAPIPSEFKQYFSKIKL